MSNLNLPEPEEEFNLDSRQKLGSLQIGAVAHIMMIVEDMAILFTSLKNDDHSYYKLLDQKEYERDAIVERFYKEADKLQDDEIQKILSYVDPKDLKDSNESEKDFLRFIIKKNIQTMRYFLAKSGAFWSSHIEAFHRYTHAGFPMILGISGFANYDMMNNFDLATYPFTSQENTIVGTNPVLFSKKSLDSYKVFLEDLSSIISYTIQNNQMKTGISFDGIIPNPDDILGKRLTKNEWKRLKKIYDGFVSSLPTKSALFDLPFELLEEYPAWYEYLEIYAKPSIDLAIEKEELKSGHSDEKTSD